MKNKAFLVFCTCPDEVVAGSMVTQGGEIVHPQVREAMGLAPLVAASS